MCSAGVLGCALVPLTTSSSDSLAACIEATSSSVSVTPVPHNSPERRPYLADFGIPRRSITDDRITEGSTIAEYGSISSDNEQGGVFRVINEEKSLAERDRIMKGCF